MSKRREITQKELKEVLDYNPETGIFTWRISPTMSVNIGDTAGSINKGYLMIGINNIIYSAHRLAWLYMKGFHPQQTIDHINRNRSDNRWCNLRHVTAQCNVRNTGQLNTNTSGVKGVYYDKVNSKWRPYIEINGKKHFLGRYINKYNAVLARLAAEQCLNYMNCDSSSTAYKYALEHKLIREV